MTFNSRNITFSGKLSKLKGLIENFEKEVSEIGLAVCEDSQSLHKMIKKTDKLLPHHQISYKTDRGLVGVTQERKEDMPQSERNVAERKKLKKKLSASH